MSNMKAGSQRYAVLLDEALTLHLNKNQGYSADDPDAFANFRLAEGMGLTAVQGVLVRLGDKFARVQALAKNPANNRVNESMRDTLMDLSAYALIAICLMEEETAAAYDKKEVQWTYTQSVLGHGLTCYNRNDNGECRGHPVKGGPFYHDPENAPEILDEETDWHGRGRDADGTL